MNLFISHSSSDSTHVKAVVAHFHHHILASTDVSPTFIASYDYPPAVPWRLELQNHLSRSEGAILLLSPDYFRSGWCMWEFEVLSKRFELSLSRYLRPVVLRAYEGEIRNKGTIPSLNLLNTEPLVQGDVLNTDRLESIQESLKKWVVDLQRSSRPRPTTGATKSSPLTSWDDLKTEIGDHGSQRVSYFIGPDINNLRHCTSPASTKAVGQAWHNVELIKSTLPTRNSKAASYVERIVDDALPKVKPSDAGDADFPSEFIDFQCALAQLGSYANQNFFEHARTATTSPVLIAPLNLDDPGTEPLHSYFCDCLDSLDSLLDLSEYKPRGKHYSLGAVGIRQALLILGETILGDRSLSSYTEHLFETKEHELIFSSLVANQRHYSSPHAHCLTSSHLEWLADLLWHTIRFQLKIYPSFSELAFQTAVCTDLPTPPRRESLGTIIALIQQKRNEKLADWLVDWLTPIARSQSHSSAYDAFANQLVSQLPEICPDEKLPYDVVPIVVTTNLDDELERAFHRLHRSYSILFPVVRNDATRDWVLKHVEFSPSAVRNDRVIEYSKQLDFKTLGIDFIYWHQFAGPLIVKPYGSPLDSDIATVGEDLRHQVTVSDVDILRKINRNDFWPNGFVDMIFSKKFVCLLGFSPVSFDGRLRIFDQAHRRPERQDAGIDPAILLDSPDPFYDAYLNRLRTKAIEASLQSLLTLDLPSHSQQED